MSELHPVETNPLTSKFYHGIWGVLARVFKVPREAPSLPVRPGESFEAFKPARGYLNKLRLEFFIGLVIAAIFLIAGVFGVSFAAWGVEFGVLGLLLSGPLALILEAVFAIFGFLAIHLRYDTMWYVMNDRSIRMRRGMWLIRETTITFENIQNVSVSQGPIQRLFGIANLKIETAGGGGASDPNSSGIGSHHGLIEGVADPHRIRDMIMARLRRSKSSGLGDDDDQAPSEHGLRPRHVALLREIRDLAKEAAATV